MGAMKPVRVSVIVPVFDPGPALDELMRSLDRQTLRPHEFEVILCDDGSGESTRQRLARIAASRSNVRVLTLAHTGWPGTPRNHGIDSSRGKYVYFADQDDRLFDDGLKSLCNYADRHGSDVVVGKVVGQGRRIPRQVFRRDIAHARLGRDPLLALLTPHKLFRTSFLRKHGIRFPDGRVRLEDHLFVMQAYFRAETISILASRSCYVWMKNAGSASSSRIDPATYFPHLSAVLDLVEANTEPGTLRDTLLRHWYRSKILNRLDGKRALRYPDDYRTTFLETVTPIAQQRFGPAVEEGLPFALRIRSKLLRDGRHDDLLRLAKFEAGLECRTEATSARWMPSGVLTLSIRVRIVRDGEDALNFDPHDDTRFPGANPARIRRLPGQLGREFLPTGVVGAQRDFGRDRVELVLRDTTDDLERRIPGRASYDPSGVAISFNPIDIFSRRDPSDGGQIMARVQRAGWSFETPLLIEQTVLQALEPSPVLAGRRCVVARRSDGSTELRRDWSAGRMRDYAARAIHLARRIVRDVRTQRIALIIASIRKSATLL